MPRKTTALSYEKAYERLQEITRRLEEEELTLSESVKLYQEGVGLYETCSKLLDEVKDSLEVLDQEKTEPKEATKEAEDDGV